MVTCADIIFLLKVSFISGIGGYSFKNAIQRALECVFRNSLAKDLNWEGGKRLEIQKRGAKTMRITRYIRRNTTISSFLEYFILIFNCFILISEGIQENLKFRDTKIHDQETFEKHWKNWFRHAPKRAQKELRDEQD